MKTSSYSRLPRTSVSTPASDTLLRTATVRRWSGVAFDKMAQWQDRATQRRQLTELDDRQLADIGVTRIDAGHESAKPFWKA